MLLTFIAQQFRCFPRCTHDIKRLESLNEPEALAPFQTQMFKPPDEVRRALWEQQLSEHKELH